MEEIENIHENCDKLLEMLSENLNTDSNIIQEYENETPNLNNLGYNKLFDNLEGNILFSKTLIDEIDEIILKLQNIKEYASERIKLDTTVGFIVNQSIREKVPSLQTYSEESVRQNVDISQLPEEQKIFAQNLLELQGHREKKGGKFRHKKTNKRKSKNIYRYK